MSRRSGRHAHAGDTTPHSVPEDMPISANDKPMPQNIAAEQAVLAAMILDPEILEEAVLVVKKDSFYRLSHQTVYEAMMLMQAAGTPVDQLSLAEKLEAMGELERIGGKNYIFDLASNSFAVANWRYHAEMVNRQSLLRKLIRASARISAMSYDAPDDTEAVVEQAEKLIFEACDDARTGARARPRSASELSDALLVARDAGEARDGCRVPTGFADLDSILGGMRGGDLVVVAARPGVGKTSFALNVAVNAAKDGAAVAFFSLEMPAEQVAMRIACADARVDIQSAALRTLDAGSEARLRSSIEGLAWMDLTVADSPAASPLSIAASASRVLHGKEKGLIVVDYLQLMESNTGYKDRHLEVAEFSRGLKMLARDLDVPVVAVSQLSRRVEEREDRRPRLSDLRESGAIEQDADIVMFVDRSANAAEAARPGRPDLGVARVVVAKHRNGPTGEVELGFDPSCTRFETRCDAVPDTLREGTCRPPTTWPVPDAWWDWLDAVPQTRDASDAFHQARPGKSDEPAR